MACRTPCGRQPPPGRARGGWPAASRATPAPFAPAGVSVGAAPVLGGAYRQLLFAPPPQPPPQPQHGQPQHGQPQPPGADAAAPPQSALTPAAALELELEL